MSLGPSVSIVVVGSLVVVVGGSPIVLNRTRRRPSARVVVGVHPGAGDSVRVAVDAGAPFILVGTCAPRLRCGCYHAAEGSSQAAGGWPPPRNAAGSTSPFRRRTLSWYGRACRRL